MFKKFLFPVLFCFIFSSQVFAISTDPLDIGVGARPMGMGKAFVGMPSANNNIFINPAGLSGLEGLNFLSMSGKLLNDVNYLSLGVINPFSFGVVGIGYVSLGIDAIPLTRLIGSTVEVYDSTSYGNSVFVVSYASELSRIAERIGFLPKFAFIDNTSFGANFKYYMQGFSNTGGAMAGATGTGMDLDIGFLYKPDSIYTLGAAMQNLLPSSLGGKFTWQKNSVEEGIPAVLKIGGTIQLLGENAWRQIGKHKLLLAIDMDMYMSEKKPGVWHTGLEWQPLEILSVRFGIDQQSSVVQVDNNMTFGVGTKYRGFTFDYAYHQYGDISDNTTHYFSIGYGKEEEKVRKSEPIKVEKAKEPVMVTKEKPFKMFSDVPEGYWAREAIGYLAGGAVIGGYPDGTFKPNKVLTRAELCTLLIKAKGAYAGTPDRRVFNDVPSSYWAAPYIKSAVDMGLVGGYEDGLFRPNKSLNRAEAVKIIAVFDGLNFVSSGGKTFPDVPMNHWANKYIAAAKESGILDYLKNKNFEPDKNLTRAEAAEIIYKTNFWENKN